MKTTVKRWPYLLTGSIVFLCVGIVYAWSIFASIFKTSFHSWTSTELATTFTIIMGLFCIGNLSAGFISRKLSARAMLLICAALIGGGFMSVSLVQENTIWLLYLGYGAIGSFGVGLAYNTVLSTVTRWFPEKVGTASGTLMMSFAFSTLILGIGVDALAQVMSWRVVFALVGVFIALVLAWSSSILKVPERDAVLPQKAVMPGAEAVQTIDISVPEMLRSSAFWLFFVWGVLLLIPVYGLMGNVKQCVIELDKTAVTIGTLSVTLLAVSNGIGRLLLGSLYDRVGRKKTMTIDTLLIIMSSAAMIAAFRTCSIPLTMLGVMLTGLAYGGLPPISSAFAVDFFGPSNYPMKFGIVSLTILVG
ncbi:MAG TPA: MFS transporter, partial [Thermodesulfobacteriota bacterium]|nr:MFS transporter [Thermodesulfobacteriota bacterium]